MTELKYQFHTIFIIFFFWARNYSDGVFLICRAPFYSTNSKTTYTAVIMCSVSLTVMLCFTVHKVWAEYPQGDGMVCASVSCVHVSSFDKVNPVWSGSSCIRWMTNATWRTNVKRLPSRPFDINKTNGHPDCSLSPLPSPLFDIGLRDTSHPIYLWGSHVGCSLNGWVHLPPCRAGQALTTSVPKWFLSSRL